MMLGALVHPTKPKRTSRERQEFKMLQREIHRKDKALAEVTALLTLKKKADLLWGVEEDDTTV